MKKNDTDVYIGSARLTSNSSVEITDSDGAVRNLTANNIVLATGSHPAVPAALSPNGDNVLTYREAIVQSHLPSSVVIVGGGAIGVEFATIWNSYGSQVTIVEMMPRILPLEDEQVSAELTRAFHKSGIKIVAGAKVEGLETSNQSVEVTVSSKKGFQTIAASQVLIAIGFAPNTDNLGLGTVAIERDAQGFIKVDDYMRTNIDGIYAIGDVTGKLQLAHVASAQGVVTAEIIAGAPTVKLDYRMMPRATYCHPEVASFGYSDIEAREAGYEVKTARFDFRASGKALGMGDYGGWAKIVSDAKYGEILGAHLIGPQVTELLPELTLAQKMELTGEEIARNVHAHPTLSEAVMEASHGLVGKIINS
jgi:dihydrolipoamide dehydrogenase